MSPRAAYVVVFYSWMLIMEPEPYFLEGREWS